MKNVQRTREKWRLALYLSMRVASSTKSLHLFLDSKQRTKLKTANSAGTLFTTTGRHVALSFRMFKNTLDMKANIHFGTLRDTDVVKFDDDIPCLDLARSRSSAEKSDGDL